VHAPLPPQRILAKSSSGWMVGSTLSIADLATYGRVLSFKTAKYDDIPANIVDAFPHVTGARAACVPALCAHLCACEYARLLTVAPRARRAPALYDRVLALPKVAEWNAMPHPVQK
jgi:glutathione S-transferase